MARWSCCTSSIRISPNALTAITNAFLAVGNLMDIGQGTANAATPGGNGVIPAATINSLANLLVPCSNAANLCPALFALAPDSAGNPPADTVQALLNINRNPAANVAGGVRSEGEECRAEVGGVREGEIGRAHV